MDIVSLIIAWLVTSVSFFIISKLPIGVDIDTFGKAMVSAAVFGLLNALLRPVFMLFSFPALLITFGLFMIVINAAIFGLAAWLVEGFRLRWGIWSALLGAIALGFINSFLYSILPNLR
ncbi:MAG: phage holin family protein [Microcoleus sp. PH2017_10_PVI_O_A]|uniref:phage holin family protein n=1 Tax=unclassified Microcoleus TaxID=2642155 RepID=UPI001D5AA476|nr:MULTISPECIES: phage holin family protein [unclassified Microcoleus]TAE81337.1 MAG: phage holin family protein [Oscillatoriales cyanobacterium]MCC3405397.1 phage holin family protein [Microcoleus sp. PH2017_10_PVI_O_A]MCC3459389.1 phage holin family protein [Microcoleus sp. PH2017_11_PCY_U_A]MCC3477670.1 phage holin family protein [Microcoleus sp. PH2017_12_PCY_D_A]MCC3527392.1 phage holin family protein [Microcoleus sp. PH2017_21_RUC_O_A]